MILVHNNPEKKPRVVSRSRCRTGSLCLVILRRLCETFLGFCLRVIVNEFHPNLQKTTSSVLSEILINPEKKPRGVSRSRCRTDSLCFVILRRLRETFLGFCLRVIVNEFHPNLQKTTSSVLYLLF